MSDWKLTDGHWERGPGGVVRWVSDPRLKLLRKVTRERYKPAPWWSMWDDSELTCARRRRAAEEESRRFDRKAVSA